MGGGDAQSIQSARLSVQSSELGSPLPHPQASVSPLLFGSKGETHSLAGKGMGDPIPTKGQTLWYSMYNPSTGGCMGQKREEAIVKIQHPKFYIRLAEEVPRMIHGRNIMTEKRKY